MPDPTTGRDTTRTVAANAGRPTQATNQGLTGGEAPSDEELDRRDRMKSGPRRQAGPPLEGAGPEAAPVDALAGETLPAPTDPAEPAG